MSELEFFDRTFHFIMKVLVETGRAPHYTDIAKELGVTMDDGRKIMHALFASGVPGWVYPNTDYITSFPPFNTLPTHFRITIEGQQNWFAQ